MSEECAETDGFVMDSVVAADYWLGFFAVSAVVKYAVVVILVAVTAAVMAYWHKKKGQVVADDVWPSSLPPETYRQPVVLVCGDMSAHLFTDSPVRQVSEGLYLPVSDEEQLVAQVERLLTLRPAWASQFAVAYTVMPGMYRDAAVLTGQLRRFAHSMATVRRRAGVNVPGFSGAGCPARRCRRERIHRGLSVPAAKFR